MKLDAVIIAPGNQRETYQNLVDADLPAIEPNCWARLIASYLERKGASVEIVDQAALNESAEWIAGYVGGRATLRIIVAHGQQPSASTQLMPEVIRLSRAMKALLPIGPVLIVGGHPAALPERTLKETGADFVCTGEGPVTAWEVLQALPCKGTDLPRGVVMDLGKDYGVIKTPPAPNVWDLSEMPGGQWDKLPTDRYRAHNWACFQEKSRQPYASIYTSLGCPFACSFCCIQSPFREGDALKYAPSNKNRGYAQVYANSYRTWPLETTMVELETLVEKHNVTNIKIADEMFVLRPSHFIPLCKAITERWGDKLNFWAYARVDTCKEEYLDVLRAAGVKWLCLGVESASNAQRDGVEKADYDEEDIVRTTDKIWESGINLILNMIYGLPDDDEASLRANYDLIQDIEPEFLNLYCAVAYPGTKLYDEAKRNGWKLPETWSGYSHHSIDYQPLPTKYLTAEQVLRARDRDFDRFYTDDRYLKRMRREFGPHVEGQIKAMTEVKLKRKLLEVINE